MNNLLLNIRIENALIIIPALFYLTLTSSNKQIITDRKVILSFYAVTQSLDQINARQDALLGLVAGFPLGFIIHNLSLLSQC